MKWMTSLVLLGAIGSVHLYCFNPNDKSYPPADEIDLSGITDFGVDLYKQLSPANSTENFFFSPYSIWTALTLAYFGSAGNTQRELEAALRVSDKVSAYRLVKGLEKAYELQQQNNTLYTFDVANRAYFHAGLQLRPCMKDILSNELRIVNFFDTVGSAKDINSFVNQTTKGRISSVVKPVDLVDAVMVLVNAAFFKGTWKHQFEPSNNFQGTFSISPNSSAPVTMMSQKGQLRYGISTQLGARILHLPYSGEVMSMFILLPTSDRPLGARFENMVNNLNVVRLREVIHPNNLDLATVDVQLPKFKFALEVQDELIMALKRMGIRDLFREGIANLTAFEPYEGMNIDKAIHKSFVEVNEEGTEAAAVTALISITRSSSGNPEVINFHCDEPFIFLIYDNQNANVLFMGAIKNPHDLQTENQ